MRRLYLILISSLVALFVAEMSLRRWFPVGGMIYALHPQLLHATRPNSRRIQPMPQSAGGARSLIVINSAGYRGPELEQSGRPRVAVYGDSLVMGENVAWEDTFVARLAGEWGRSTGGGERRSFGVRARPDLPSNRGRVGDPAARSDPARVVCHE
jgi:hypothetical protein